MEHRWGERYALERMVSLHAGAWRVLARMENVSCSGAFLRCAVPSAGVVRIRIDLRQGPGAARLVAYIVRRTADGIGVEWGEFAPEAVTGMLPVQRDRRAASPPLHRRARVGERPRQA
jgi:hypothetical protein